MQRVKNQPANTVINITRVVFSAILVYTALAWELRVLALVLIGGLVCSVLWLLATETFFEETRYPAAAYLPTTLDLFIITIFIYFSGTTNSLMAAGYVFSVSLCSLNTQIRQGLYATIVSIVAYVIIVMLVYLDWLPAINVFGGAAQVTLANLLFAYFFVPSSVVLIYLLVHGLVVRNEALIEEARAAGEAKMEFLANMSHEIRTPLNAILGVADLLNDSKLNNEQTQLVKVFRKSGRLLLQIVNDVLDFAKIEAREIRLQEVAFDPEQVLHDVHDTYRLAATEKNLKMTQSVRASNHYECFGDPDRLHQILGNIIGNAVKFTDAGEIELALEIQTAGDEALLRYRIRDTGVGMRPDDMRQLFGRFVQLPGRGRRSGGTGLGLAISQELARLMGGRITARSEAGRGSEFTVELTFPILRVTAGLDAAATRTLQSNAKRPAKASEAETERPQRTGAEAACESKKKILIVEDAEENRFLLEHYLKNAGHEITYAENGAEAVAAFESAYAAPDSESTRFDLLFMDLQMPVMDGYEAIRRIRAIEALRNGGGDPAGRGPIPIVALTAHAMRQDANRALEAGADYYLTKPISKERFLSAIQDYAAGDRATLDLD